MNKTEMKEKVLQAIRNINYPSLKTEVCNLRPYGQW